MSEQEQDQFETEEQEAETQEQEEHRDDEQADTEQTESEEFFIGIDGEEPQQQEDEFHGQPAPKWVKETREENRANKKRIRELEAQLASQTKPQEIELGEKPTIETVGYDTDELERQLDEWYSKKAQYDQQEQAKKAEQEKANKNWQDRVSNYEAKKAELKTKHKVRDYDEAEEVARGTLNELQQNMIVMGAKQPELLIYHLGTNPEKARKLASITDPIQFAFEAGSLDHQLKVQTRKPQTSPERKVTGSGSLSGTTDSTLEKLRATAAKTGDYTPVIKYKQQKRQKE